ncbi:post-GPI attachment to proteins factor 2 isoform X2 [Copidosoma floridanum]|uniref:post-GPI attachment to proteins factor 2 isoform X2 n=1 Tax=Copidosoma floridanum TaxID=29053 RepID=UPI0006C94E87|nr:post-GPI attachment to proteins factor 2 isoform X2 [Copidosoma floridanum]
MSRLQLGYDYIPLVNKDVNRFRLVLSFSKIAWFTVLVPFLSFVFCIIWSILYNFENATETHCNVYNFLPSVSAAIGHYRPQKTIWKAAITVQAMVRALVLYMYYQYYVETVYKWAQAIHKIAFMTFLFMSLIHMILSYLVAKTCCNVTKDTNSITSLRWKFNSLILNVIAIVLACYFFYRHNKYCEPFVYSLFALAEYVVVVTNMAFHVTAAHDFAGRRLFMSLHKIQII